MIVTPMDVIIILFLSYLAGCLSMTAYSEYFDFYVRGDFD